MSYKIERAKLARNSGRRSLLNSMETIPVCRLQRLLRLLNRSDVGTLVLF